METPRTWIGWTLAAGTTTAVLVLVLAPPFISDGPRHLVMAAFSSVCHQIPNRSPHVSGVQLAVCHRCLGIYAALAAAPVLFLGLRRWDQILHAHTGLLVLAAVVVPGLDWTADVTGVWTNTPWSRALTGATFGIAAGYLLTRAAIGLTAAPGDEEPGGCATTVKMQGSRGS